ncbi:unnamed protein product [Adineta steineri]|uniref:Transposase Tc1-like domain-containing protein n=1 Tax=Adineta steineri TaxID=433720 RepID=A0A815QTK2_9BILA|nr:unnamed protein product [Adineta steineri]CAF4180827.1 unnamed protein product [Adineta steineri]
MGKKTINEIKRAQAVALFDAGFSIADVARQLDISWTCVKNAIKRFRTHATFKDLPRTGRPSRITQRTARYIKRLTKGENRLNSHVITKKLNNSLPKHISKRTVVRNLHKLGYSYAAKNKTIFKEMP